MTLTWWFGMGLPCTNAWLRVFFQSEMHVLKTSKNTWQLYIISMIKSVPIYCWFCYCFKKKTTCMSLIPGKSVVSMCKHPSKCMKYFHSCISITFIRFHFHYIIIYHLLITTSYLSILFWACWFLQFFLWHMVYILRICLYNHIENKSLDIKCIKWGLILYTFL